MTERHVWVWTGSPRDPRGDWIMAESLWIPSRDTCSARCSHGDCEHGSLCVISLTITCELAVGSAWDFWVFLKHSGIHTHTHTHTHTQVCMETLGCGWWVLCWHHHFSFLATSLPFCIFLHCHYYLPDYGKVFIIIIMFNIILLIYFGCAGSSLLWGLLVEASRGYSLVEMLRLTR